jgi:hypothetical protein
MSNDCEPFCDVATEAAPDTPLNVADAAMDSAAETPLNVALAAIDLLIEIVAVLTVTPEVAALAASPADVLTDSASLDCKPAESAAEIAAAAS